MHQAVGLQIPKIQLSVLAQASGPAIIGTDAKVLESLVETIEDCDIPASTDIPKLHKRLPKTGQEGTVATDRDARPVIGKHPRVIRRPESRSHSERYD